MSKRLKLKSASFIFSILYLTVGVALFIILFQSAFTLFHVGLLAILNLIASYGLIKKEKWAIYLSTCLSFIGVVFCFIIIYTIFQLPNLSSMEIFILLEMTLYAAFSVTSLLYIPTRRDKFR